MELMEIAQLLGNFGEFVGAIAVVLTLIYLAVQVRHSKESMDENTRALEENRTLTRADMERQFVQQWDQVNYQISENRDIASIIRRGIEDVESIYAEGLNMGGDARDQSIAGAMARVEKLFAEYQKELNYAAA